MNGQKSIRFDSEYLQFLKNLVLADSNTSQIPGEFLPKIDYIKLIYKNLYTFGCASLCSTTEVMFAANMLVLLYLK